MNSWNYPDEYGWKLFGGGWQFNMRNYSQGDFLRRRIFSGGEFLGEYAGEVIFLGRNTPRVIFQGEGTYTGGLHLDPFITLPLYSCSRNHNSIEYQNAWVPCKIISILRHIEGCGCECRKVATIKIKGIPKSKENCKSWHFGDLTWQDRSWKLLAPDGA